MTQAERDQRLSVIYHLATSGIQESVKFDTDLFHMFSDIAMRVEEMRYTTVTPSGRFDEVDEKITQEELVEVFGSRIPLNYALMLTGNSLGGPLEARRAINKALDSESTEAD